MPKDDSSQKQRPAQTQPRQPGIESEMDPLPRAEDLTARSAAKLTGKVALITGGDSGIGRAVAIAFAREGADVAIAYLDEAEQGDAETTAKRVRELGGRCFLIKGDIGRGETCREIVEQTVKQAGKLDILVNNAAEQHQRE